MQGAVFEVWNVARKAPKAFFARYPEHHPTVAQLLYSRGVRSQQEVDAFFNPDYETDLHDPFLLSGMEDAVSIIAEALKGEAPILIYGDYDADGVCASALLREAFSFLGTAPVSVTIPHREEEGYGLNEAAIRAAKERGVGCIVTVDCGSTNIEEVALARELGMKVVVTDHHTVRPQVPAAHAFINPHKDDDEYPFKGLSGTAVAFKLAVALMRRSSELGLSVPPPGWEKWFLDLVAISTVTDVMPLVGENRALVHYGLFVLAQTRRVGLRELMKVAKVHPALQRAQRSTNLSPFTLGFALGPRLNAAGRMEHAHIAFELVSTSDGSQAKELARKLDELNRRRQAVVRGIMEEITPDSVQGEAAVVRGSEGWPIGVLGIVAGRIADTYGKPAFIYQRQQTQIVGSARTPAHIHTVSVLQECSTLLRKFGGHAQAGGFTAELSQEEAFVHRLQEHVATLDSAPRTLSIDARLREDDLSWEFYDALQSLAPYGQGNPEPLFLLEGVRICQKQIVGSGSHARFLLQVGERRVKGMAFRIAETLSAFEEGDWVDAALRLAVDEYNGRRDLMVELVDIRAAR